MDMLKFHKSHNKMATVMSCLFQKTDSAINYGNFVKDVKTNGKNKLLFISNIYFFGGKNSFIMRKNLNMQ